MGGETSESDFNDTEESTSENYDVTEIRITNTKKKEKISQNNNKNETSYTTISQRVGKKT